MEGKTLKSILILLELKNVFLDLLKKKYKYPALLNIYSFIDICASLSKSSNLSNRKNFESFIENFHDLKLKPFTAYDLWSARCSVLHAFSPIGDHTKNDGEAKTIFYYSYPEKPEDFNSILEKRGYKDFILINIDDIKWVAIDAFNNFHRRVEKDPSFEKLVNENANHLLSNLEYFLLEDELILADKLRNLEGEK